MATSQAQVLNVNVEVLSIEQISGTGKNGPYAFAKVHCIALVRGQRVGCAFINPKGQPNPPTGAAVLTVAPFVRDGRLEFLIEGCLPVSSMRAAA